MARHLDSNEKALWGKVISTVSPMHVTKAKAQPVAAAASKPAKKKAKKAEEITHLPAPDIRTYSIEAGDPFTVSYYASGKHDYADVVFRVNGTMEYGEYEVQVAKDGRSILFVCAIRAKSFNKTIL